MAPDGTLTVVSIESSPDAQLLEVGPPTALFTPRIASVYPGSYSHQYAVATDGQRFLVNVTTEEPTIAGPITLMLNWTAALEGR